MMARFRNLFLSIVVFVVLPLKALAFTKVIVPSVYKEWQQGKPHWATDPALQQKHNYTLFTYQKVDSNAPNYFEYNRGTETGVYLKYVVDHYDNFPDVAIFVHAKPQEHQPNWLNMVGCISPNATWYHLNYGHAPWITRNPDYWEEDGPVQEQCWRDLIQITWELKDNKEEFNRRFPPIQPFTMRGPCCNQFLVSRAMIHKRPLHVWKELLQVIAMQPTCHVGDLDFENLFEFNNTGRVKQNEKPYYEKFKESATNPKGAYVQGVAGEHLNHVIFGHKAFQMKPPTPEERCQNFIKGCPGSPCEGTPLPSNFPKTVLVKAKTNANKFWYAVIHKGKRHIVPDYDTLEGLEVPSKSVEIMDSAEVERYPEGPALTPCDKSFVPNTCKESVYYKALHNVF